MFAKDPRSAALKVMLGEIVKDLPPTTWRIAKIRRSVEAGRLYTACRMLCQVGPKTAALVNSRRLLIDMPPITGVEYSWGHPIRRDYPEK